MREIFHHWWSAQKKFLHSKDALVYLAFVLLATVIWLVHAYSTRRTHTIQVPVTYVGMPDNYLFTSEPSATLRLTIEDEGADFFHSRNKQYALVFDISDQICGEQGEVVLLPDDIRQAVAQQLTGDAAMISFEPEELHGAYTRQHEKKVPVVYRGQVHPALQYQLCGEPVIAPEKVSVYGTLETLKAIKSVETVLTDYEGVQDTFRTKLALQPIEGVRMLPDSVGLSIVAEQFTDKALTIPIHVSEAGNASHVVHLFPNQVQVTFRIGTNRFNCVSERDFEAYVELPEQVADHLPVHIRCKNSHITHLRVKPEEVEYLIESR